MKTIWKTNLELVPSQVLELPQGARLLTVQAQGDDLAIWYECDPKRALQARSIVLIGTGHDMPDTHTLRYISTVQQGAFVWHFYEAVQ